MLFWAGRLDMARYQLLSLARHLDLGSRQLANERQAEMWINGVIYGRIMTLYNEVISYGTRNQLCAPQWKKTRKYWRFFHASIYMLWPYFDFRLSITNSSQIWILQLQTCSFVAARVWNPGLATQNNVFCQAQGQSQSQKSKLDPEVGSVMGWSTTHPPPPLNFFWDANC